MMQKPIFVLLVSFALVVLGHQTFQPQPKVRNQQRLIEQKSPRIMDEHKVWRIATTGRPIPSNSMRRHEATVGGNRSSESQSLVDSGSGNDTNPPRPVLTGKQICMLAAMYGSLEYWSARGVAVPNQRVLPILIPIIILYWHIRHPHYKQFQQQMAIPDFDEELSSQVEAVENLSLDDILQRFNLSERAQRGAVQEMLLRYDASLEKCKFNTRDCTLMNRIDLVVADVSVTRVNNYVEQLADWSERTFGRFASETGRQSTLIEFFRWVDEFVKSTRSYYKSQIPTAVATSQASNVTNERPSIASPVAVTQPPTFTTTKAATITTTTYATTTAVPINSTMRQATTFRSINVGEISLATSPVVATQSTTTEVPDSGTSSQAATPSPKITDRPTEIFNHTPSSVSVGPLSLSANKSSVLITGRGVGAIINHTVTNPESDPTQYAEFLNMVSSIINDIDQVYNSTSSDSLQ